MMHRELGDFLRARRTRLTPQSLRLPAGPRRRTPGLRREEVAERAGIGVDWYIRIEQGRAVNPSPSTVDALAGALQLDALDHAHLRALAGHAMRAPFVRERVPDPIVRMVERLQQPAYVTGQRWDLLAWNSAAAELFTDFTRLPEEHRNILAYMLCDPSARRLFGAGWADEARRMVAHFRATYDLWAGDPAFEGLIANIRTSSPEFAGWWARHEVRAGVSGHKTLHHPAHGRLQVAYTTFQANDDPALKLSIFARLQDVHPPRTR